MSWLSLLTGASGGPLGLALGLGSMYLGKRQGDAADAAADQAQGLSQQQIEMLKRILGIQTQYGDPLLARAFELIQPRDSAWQRNQFERGREDINRAFRPAYGQELQHLSSRNMLSEPNSYAPSRVNAMDRARASAIADYAAGYRENRMGEEWQNLGRFSDILGQQTGAGLGVSQGFQNPIDTYAGLATQAGAGQYDVIAGLMRLWQMQQMQKQATPGPYTPPPTGGGGTPAGGGYGAIPYYDPSKGYWT